MKMDLEDFAQIIADISDDKWYHIQQRPVISKSEDDWVDKSEEDLASWDTVHFEYRAGNGDHLSLSNDGKRRVTIRSKELGFLVTKVNLRAFSRLIKFFATLRHKGEYYQWEVKVGNEGYNLRYDPADPLRVKVGCQIFEWSELEEFYAANNIPFPG